MALFACATVCFFAARRPRSKFRAWRTSLRVDSARSGARSLGLFIRGLEPFFFFLRLLLGPGTRIPSGLFFFLFSLFAPRVFLPDSAIATGFLLVWFIAGAFGGGDDDLVLESSRARGSRRRCLPDRRSYRLSFFCSKRLGGGNAAIPGRQPRLDAFCTRCLRSGGA